MSPFAFWGNDNKKGLEIIAGNPPIVIKYNGKRIGVIYKNNNDWEFLSENSYANSDTLRKIAAKLDELNGVKS